MEDSYIANDEEFKKLYNQPEDENDEENEDENEEENKDQIGEENENQFENEYDLKSKD